MKKLCALATMLALGSYVAAAPDDNLRTEAERSGYQRTGRYPEVEKLCQAFRQKWPDWVACEQFGVTPEGRPMWAMVVSRSGALSPEQARARDIPVLLMQGGIHSGEIDGKDAGFLALRQMLLDQAAPQALEKCVVVFVPVFNIDGHERFGRWNRPNQVGPEEMGWRTTAQNLNLNRDYAKADAPEMRSMLALLNRWDPILYADLHVTDGAQFQHDIANLVEPIFMGEPTLRPLALALQNDVNEKLKAQGSLPLSFYPSPRDHNNPASGFAQSAYPPRFSTGYWALRNRLAILVETHSWKDYPWRVKSTKNLIVALAENTARQGRRWREVAHQADQACSSLDGRPLTLTYKTTDKQEIIDFQGYAYKFEPSEISGGKALRYDPKTPQVWKVPLFPEVVADLQIAAPKGGYLIPAAHAAWLKTRLDAHGIQFHILKEDLPKQPLGAFRAHKVQFSSRPFEGRQTATLQGAWGIEPHACPTGSLFVPMAQPKARLIAALLEPQAPDSFAAWGFFNAHFEVKEYMEDYVAEDVGREMLATRPEIAAEFKRRLANEADFAKSPQARLEFFYRHHPSWDERLNLYPVLRIDRVPSGL